MYIRKLLEIVEDEDCILVPYYRSEVSHHTLWNAAISF
jgi:hypothetical protein